MVIIGYNEGNKITIDNLKSDKYKIIPIAKSTAVKGNMKNN